MSVYGAIMIIACLFQFSNKIYLIVPFQKSNSRGRIKRGQEHTRLLLLSLCTFDLH